MVRLRLYSIELLLVGLLLVAVGYFGILGYGLLTPAFVIEPFSGERALQYAQQQMEFGDRSTGTPNNIRMGDWLVEELRLLGWDVVIQPFTTPNNTPARNIIAIRSAEPAPARAAMLITRYDTRLFADRDPDPANQIQAAPGANAGASGPALLLELARTLDVIATGHTVCLVFLDAEGNGGLQGWEPMLGSRQMIARLDSDIPRCRTPRFALYLDMVGSQNQRFFVESSSYSPLVRAIWETAAELGYGNWFINEPTWSADDAHSLFRKLDVPAATLAEYNYPHRDTLSDTLEQLSVESFNRVGQTLKTWLERGAPY